MRGACTRALPGIRPGREAISWQIRDPWEADDNRAVGMTRFSRDLIINCFGMLRREALRDTRTSSMIRPLDKLRHLIDEHSPGRELFDLVRNSKNTGAAHGPQNLL